MFNEDNQDEFSSLRGVGDKPLLIISTKEFEAYKKKREAIFMAKYGTPG